MRICFTVRLKLQGVWGDWGLGVILSGAGPKGPYGLFSSFEGGRGAASAPSPAAQYM